MSEKNREGKRTARERLREERLREQARHKRKRAAIVAAGIVAVLAIAAGVGIAVSSVGGSGGAVAVPKGATGKDQTAILTGSTGAPSTLAVYEDFRCPACDAFEKGYRDTLYGLEDSGQLKVEYHLVTLIDGNLGGSGSLTAGNAAACAQDADRFRPYHDVLYDNQPDEREDKFADTGYLLQLADKVPGLRTAAFASCVNGGRYTAWVKKSNSDFNSSGYGSTPTVLLNGKSVYGNQAAPLTPDKLKAMVAAANRGRAPGSVPPSQAGSPSPSRR